ncbi:hypothetical protein [Streptomyces roseoverticillatus]|uniref:hypothetical protein n=1 Tax=Streptomyces roseoverticillatus TaxID=66429 RepID=UPI000695031F|nr:hypothetical protein [Streptomyces roseoverticillatus]
MSHPDTDAIQARREALAQQLTEKGDLRSAEWRSAVLDTPRHVFVPTFYRQIEGTWQPVTAGHPDYFDHVYSDRSLTTQVTGNSATSSSSQPSLMLQMLEALDVQDGDKIGEVATGTGYNGALICHRIGETNFVTVEVDRNLARIAKARLRAAGYAPAVMTGDARAGFPGDVTLDRLIVTCGFSTFPYVLARSVRPGGVIVSPIGWGNARLTKGKDGTLEGKFLPGGSCFMPARGEGDTGHVPYPGEPEHTTERATATNFSLLKDEGLCFLSSLALPDVGTAIEMDENGTVTGYRLWRQDGSWARVHGGRAQQGGPRRLWDTIEHAIAWFQTQGSPARDRFGATVTPAGQRFWLDEPKQRVPLAV